MSINHHGFSLLEVMMVLILLSLTAQFIVPTFPQPASKQALHELERSARMAWEQSQIEGRIWRMQINKDTWKLFTLNAGESGESGPFPGTIWVPAMGSLSQGRVHNGKLQISHEGVDLWPVSLLFMPDGEMTHADIFFHQDDGKTDQLSLDSALLSGINQ